MKSFILGTDWWTDCDDVLALRVLARAHKAGNAFIEGIGINACMDHSVSSVVSFLKSEQVYDIPIGIDLNATDFGGNPSYQEYLSGLDGEAVSNKDASDAVSLYRRILTECDHPVEIIEIGYLNVIAQVLKSSGDSISPLTGAELIKQKVPKIWVMAGKWDELPGKENNFCRNERSRIAGEEFCRLCPVPVTFLGYEVGCDVLTGADMPENDIFYPILEKYNASGRGRPSWDPMLVAMVIAGDEAKAGYDTVSGRAFLNSETGENTFVPQDGGLHKYVVKKMDNSYYANKINEIIY